MASITSATPGTTAASIATLAKLAFPITGLFVNMLIGRMPATRSGSGRPESPRTPQPNDRQHMTSTWTIVLVKDFESAKQRLAPALRPEERRRLSRANAELAIAADGAADRMLAVCGSRDAAELAEALGREVLLEAQPQAQNSAAPLGITHAASAGARAVLFVSSDLPLVTRDAIAEMLRVAHRVSPPTVVAAPAIGRQGTNAIYLAPPAAVGLHFGDNSLARSRTMPSDAGQDSGCTARRALALDLDRPSDLELLQHVGSGDQMRANSITDECPPGYA